MPALNAEDVNQNNVMEICTLFLNHLKDETPYYDFVESVAHYPIVDQVISQMLLVDQGFLG